MMVLHGILRTWSLATKHEKSCYLLSQAYDPNVTVHARVRFQIGNRGGNLFVTGTVRVKYWTCRFGEELFGWKKEKQLVFSFIWLVTVCKSLF
jgi:hypothetical protein